MVKPGSHSLIHDGKRFDGSAQLALVHELLHPSQMIRELADQGSLGRDTERRTQMREQDIAVELGKVPGKDFPDVRGSEMPYDAVADHADPQPYSAPANEFVPVAPIRYKGPAHFQPAQPSWPEAGGGSEFPRYAAVNTPAAGLPSNLVPNLRPDFGGGPNAADSKPVRYLSSRVTGKSVPSRFGVGITAPPLVPLGDGFDPRQATIGDRFEGWAAPNPAVASRGWSQSEMPLVGLVSGKPMSFYSVQPPIWNFPESSAPNEDADDWLTRLLQGIRSR